MIGWPKPICNAIRVSKASLSSRCTMPTPR
jgi:hypothetical protein